MSGQNRLSVIRGICDTSEQLDSLMTVSQYLHLSLQCKPKAVSSLSLFLYLSLHWLWRAPSCCSARPLPTQSQCSSPRTAAGSAHRTCRRSCRSPCARWPWRRPCNDLLQRWAPTSQSRHRRGSAGQRLHL